MAVLDNPPLGLDSKRVMDKNYTSSYDEMPNSVSEQFLQCIVKIARYCAVVSSWRRGSLAVTHDPCDPSKNGDPFDHDPQTNFHLCHRL